MLDVVAPPLPLLISVRGLRPTGDDTVLDPAALDGPGPVRLSLLGGIFNGATLSESCRGVASDARPLAPRHSGRGAGAGSG